MVMVSSVMISLVEIGMGASLNQEVEGIQGFDICLVLLLIRQTLNTGGAVFRERVG